MYFTQRWKRWQERVRAWLSRQQRHQLPRGARPRLEALEERTLLSAAAFSFDQTSPLPPLVTVRQGSLTTVLPPGARGPSQWDAQTVAFDLPVPPNTSADFSGPVTTNKWWSALAYPSYPPDPNPVITLQPHPLAMRTNPPALCTSYPTNVHPITDAPRGQ